MYNELRRKLLSANADDRRAAAQYKNAMEMLWQRRDEYDLTWPGHHAKPVEKDIILQFIEAAELLGEGKLASRVCESPFGSYRLAEYKDVGIEF